MKNNNDITLSQVGKIVLLAGLTVMLVVSLHFGAILAVIGAVVWLASKAEK